MTLCSLVDRLGFGSTPGDPREHEALLRTRVASFIGVSGAIWATTLFFQTAAPFLLGDGVRFLEAVGAMRLLHVFGSLSLLGLWWYCRRATPGLHMLGILDALGVVLQSLLIVSFAAAIPTRYRPELVVLVGLTNLLAVRAALVPSTALRTATLGAVAVLPLVAVTLHHNQLEPNGTIPPTATTFVVAVWSGIAVCTTAVISRIIYRLARAVERAARLGQYVLEEKLGEGGMGIVYRARHALLRRPTAVKLLPPERAGVAAITRFEREVQLTARLHHPNTIAVYDYGRTPDGVFYYAMELLDGLDLETIVREDGPMPPARARDILVQIAGALGEAHDAGLVHRDVKPANVVISRRGRALDVVKVLDFGLVKDLAAPDEPGASTETTLAGTPLYMSPESIRSPATIDGRSDLYALGALAYFLLTGAPPFLGATVVEVCSHHLHDEPAPPSRRLGRPLPASLEAIVLACLAKSPAERPRDADALVDRLLACDDLEAWPRDAAELWWRERAPSLRAGRGVPTPGSADTLAVDLASRAPEPR